MKPFLRQSFSSYAFRFVMLIGIVNLFADITYEGGATINGPFLGILGASGLTISIIAGLGEFLGYSLRPLAGYIADRTKKYWVVTFIGYVINLLAVPAMAFASSWYIAGLLVVAERVGRALRKPTIESMLSYTTGKFGKGWVYALNTALDETGATLGPILVAVMLFVNIDYKEAYAFLLIPSALSLTILTFARLTFPTPSALEKSPTDTGKTKFQIAYWIYMAAGSIFAAGLLSYELVAFHFAKEHIVNMHWIPLLLAFATFAGVFANLLFGKLYDSLGTVTIIGAVILSAGFAPLVFLGKLPLVIASMPLWGIGYAVQDTLLKAVVADLLPTGKRNVAFGLFYAGYGCGWLVGSIISGLLYQYSLLALVIFTASIQLASLPLFIIAIKKQKSHRG
jgi:MFS family permease